MTKNLLVIPIISVLAAFGLNSCGKDKAVEPSDCFPANYQVSYQTDIVPIIEKTCGSSTDCHSAGVTARPAFISYDAFKNEIDNGQLVQFVVEDKYMPPSWAPDSAKFDVAECGEPERELIRLWIEQGAQNN